MNSLYLTLEQAHSLATDLIEYANMQDSSQRDVFRGFEVRFDDVLTLAPAPDSSFSIYPIAERLEIEADTETTE